MWYFKAASKVWQTDSKGLLFDIFNPLTTSHADRAWTGLATDWTTADNCSDWSDDGADGKLSYPAVNGLSNQYTYETGSCDTSAKIICVQQ
jgi:hypothetical protein